MTEPFRPRFLARRYGALAVVAAVVLSVPAGAQQLEQFPPGQEQPQLDLPQAPEPAPQPREPAERYVDWVKKCETRPDTQKQQCFLTQLVVHQRNDRKRGVLLIAIGFIGEKKTPGAILRVPLALGVYLPSGMTLTVPSVKPMRIVFDSCLPGGCSGAMPLTDEVIAAMKKANNGTVDVQNIRKQTLRLPISFKGFTAGLAALDKG